MTSSDKLNQNSTKKRKKTVKPQSIKIPLLIQE